jgi:hypothetical protein
MAHHIVPINVGEDLKYPLNKPILLFMLNTKIYYCQIIYAGKDFVTLIDMQERIIRKDGRVVYIDMQIEGKTTYKKNRIDGYNLLDTKSFEYDDNKPKLISLQKKRGNDE